MCKVFLSLIANVYAGFGGLEGGGGLDKILGEGGAVGPRSLTQAYGPGCDSALRWRWIVACPEWPVCDATTVLMAAASTSSRIPDSSRKLVDSAIETCIA